MATPRIGLGGRPPPTMDLNVTYVLWAITAAAALLAGFSLIANMWIYIFNSIGAIYGWPVMYPDMNHTRWLFATGLLSVLSGAAFLMKMRVEAGVRSIKTIRLPKRLTARATGADPVLDKFQCRARVEIDVYTDELVEAIRQHPEGVSNVLEKGLAIAISDQITRYSKARIEETLKLCLGECFDLLDIAGVTLIDLRQERVVEHTPPIDSELTPENDETASAEPEAAEVAAPEPKAASVVPEPTAKSAFMAAPKAISKPIPKSAPKTTSKAAFGPAIEETAEAAARVKFP